MKSRFLVLGLIRAVSSFSIATVSSRKSSLRYIRPSIVSLASSKNSNVLGTRNHFYNNHQYYHQDHGAGQKQQQQQQPQLSLRPATLSDVTSMQRCNLATLPENYNEQFYVSYLREWPDLALVVVEPAQPTSSSATRELPRNMGSFMPSSSIWTGGSRLQHSSDKVVGYVLGKVESLSPTTSSSSSVSSSNMRWYESSGSRSRSNYNAYNQYSSLNNNNSNHHLLGHITSLAVLESHRRQGLAQSLLEELHENFARRGVSTVALHVRPSNIAACKLYERTFQYQVIERVPSYYEDGEDALLMKRFR